MAKIATPVTSPKSCQGILHRLHLLLCHDLKKFGQFLQVQLISRDRSAVFLRLTIEYIGERTIKTPKDQDGRIFTMTCKQMNSQIPRKAYSWTNHQEVAGLWSTPSLPSLRLPSAHRTHNVPPKAIVLGHDSNGFVKLKISYGRVKLLEGEPQHKK